MKIWQYKTRSDLSQIGNKGASAIEFAIILPILVLMVFGAIDFGRLFHARLILTNLAREGASIASREMSLASGAYSASGLVTMLQASSSPLDMSANGKIYIWKIVAGKSEDEREPTASKSAEAGSLNVLSTIKNDPGVRLGLNQNVYDQLVYDDAENKKAASISKIAVVEVFYEYRPITPLIMSNMVLSSRAVF